MNSRFKHISLWRDLLDDLELVDEDYQEERVLVFVVEALCQLLSSQSKCHPAAKTILRDEERVKDISWMGELVSSPFSPEVNGKTTLHDWYVTARNWENHEPIRCSRCGLRWSYNEKK